MGDSPENLRKMSIYRKFPHHETRLESLYFMRCLLIRLFCYYRENWLIEIWSQLTPFGPKLVNLKWLQCNKFCFHLKQKIIEGNLFSLWCNEICEFLLVLFHFYPFLVKFAIRVKIPFTCWALHLATREGFDYVLNLILPSPPNIKLLRGLSFSPNLISVTLLYR